MEYNGITVNIYDLDSDAFEESPEVEIGRILRELAQLIEDQGLDDIPPLEDINGNVVGDVSLSTN